MEKLKKISSLIIIFTLIIYSCLLYFVNNESYAITQTRTTNIDGIDENLYPGFKERIKELQRQYPNWTFKVFYTDLEWSDVISNQYVGHMSGPRNMIYGNNTYQGEWICSACTYRNGIWRCASPEAIRYIMDPRNSLNTSDIFQFEELTNNGYTASEITTMIRGTFLEGHTTAITNSADETGINPYYIVARILQEQGRNGSVLTNGSRGVYNPFNIGATGNSDSEVIANGTAYAQNRGWDTLEKGIVGGINFVANGYINKGQNTLYLQKFDVDNSHNGLYWHQYMQNLTAAQSEGAILRNTYINNNALSSKHTFVIPVYKNMPATPSRRPNSQGTSEITSDLVKVNVNSTINLRNAPGGTIIGHLSKDEIVTRIERATVRTGKTYWDKVRKANGVEGFVARETDLDEPVYKLYLVPINEESKPEEIPEIPTTPEIKKGDVNGDRTNNPIRLCFS